ncbi:DUF7282 domain-containing protein [Roseicyclus sp.]|uniref:DUF7282 domain-containing protein n=1 Tax=Roseicyclus sp. TaxID=1914329 RepID=UPI003FA11647
MSRIAKTAAVLALPALVLSAPAALAQDDVPSAGEARAEGADLVIDNVVARTPGYIVVTEDLPGTAPGSEPAGFAEVAPGRTEEVRVQGDFVPGVTYFVVLYEESGAEEGFQWEEGVEDYPVSEEGDHVMTTFDMMMDAGDPEEG